LWDFLQRTGSRIWGDCQAVRDGDGDGGSPAECVALGATADTPALALALVCCCDPVIAKKNPRYKEGNSPGQQQHSYKQANSPGVLQRFGNIKSIITLRKITLFFNHLRGLLSLPVLNYNKKS